MSIASLYKSVKWENSSLDTTFILSLTSLLLSLLLALAYFLNNQNSGISRIVFFFSWLFLIPLILNFSKYKIGAKVLLSWLTPMVIMIISFESKFRALIENTVNPINYFDIRVILLVTLVIPFSIIEINKTKILTLSILPSFISIAFFDPIHNYLKIGYYDVGLESPDYFLSANILTFATYIFISIAFLAIKKENYNKTKIEKEINAKLRTYLDTLLLLSKSKNIQKGDVNKVFSEILNIVQTTLKVSRISIWYYISEPSSLECKALIEKGYINYERSILDTRDYPGYFEEIKTQKILVSNDVSKTETLKELKDYLSQLHIKSMLDIPFYQDGKLGGVICLEQQFKLREWAIEDILFIKAVSDFLSYALITNQLNQQYQIIKEKNAEIEIINSHLERRISERTKELKVKNEQLTEYAFINSHKLRAPIARIDGLLNVMLLTDTINIPNELLEPFKASIRELDLVSRQINKTIEHYGSIERNQFEKLISKLEP